MKQGTGTTLVASQDMAHERPSPRHESLPRSTGLVKRISLVPMTMPACKLELTPELQPHSKSRSAVAQDRTDRIRF